MVPLPDGEHLVVAHRTLAIGQLRLLMVPPSMPLVILVPRAMTVALVLRSIMVLLILGRVLRVPPMWVL